MSDHAHCSLIAGPRIRGNNEPARKTVYFVLAAFAHERSILIGCMLLDSIIREFARWSQTIYSLQRLSISLKLILITFLDQKLSKNRLLVLYALEERDVFVVLFDKIVEPIMVRWIYERARSRYSDCVCQGVCCSEHVPNTTFTEIVKDRSLRLNSAFELLVGVACRVILHS